MNRWFKEDLKNFKVTSIFELLTDYIDAGRIKLDPARHRKLTTYTDPCHYGRKSLKAFDHGYFDEPRAIIRKCVLNYVDLYPNKAEDYCCGAGGGAWAMPFKEERVYYARFKARQIEKSGASLVVTACHNCRDQIMKSLRKEYDLHVDVKYIWELVADSLVLPGHRAGRP